MLIAEEKVGITLGRSVRTKHGVGGEEFVSISDLQRILFQDALKLRRVAGEEAAASYAQDLGEVLGRLKG